MYRNIKNFTIINELNNNELNNNELNNNGLSAIY